MNKKITAEILPITKSLIHTRRSTIAGTVGG
jgi:hypothetical protein